MINLGSEYNLKVFASSGPQSKDRLEWSIGTLKMPNSIDYKIPDIEDHFYKMPEIYTPEELKKEGKHNPIYPIVGFVASVLFPWFCFIKMVISCFISAIFFIYFYLFLVEGFRFKFLNPKFPFE